MSNQNCLEAMKRSMREGKHCMRDYLGTTVPFARYEENKEME